MSLPATDTLFGYTVLAYPGPDTRVLKGAMLAPDKPACQARLLDAFGPDAQVHVHPDTTPAIAPVPDRAWWVIDLDNQHGSFVTLHDTFFDPGPAHPHALSDVTRLPRAIRRARGEPDGLLKLDRDLLRWLLTAPLGSCWPARWSWPAVIITQPT